jgi:hypothetical protein
LDCTTLQIGVATCVPIPLIVNILRDLKDGGKIIKRMQVGNRLRKRNSRKEGKESIACFIGGKALALVAMRKIGNQTTSCSV